MHPVPAGNGAPAGGMIMPKEMKIKSFKGMDKDMKCLGFQYEVGKEYETDKAVACECGFHACEYPLDVFNYYTPSDSRFFEVEQSGEISKENGDTKVASTKIKIGAELNIAGLVKAAIQYTKERCHDEGETATGDCGAASATGDCGAASATGNCGAASATGYRGAASATGYRGAASATGKASVAMASGIEGKAMGELGCAIFLVERGEWDGETYPIIDAKAAIVDGVNIKANVYYTLKNGEIVEAVEAEV